MSEPAFMKRVERDTIDVQKALRFLSELEESGPMKPWTLVSRVKKEDEDFDELKTNVLKPLTMKGYITPNADGDLYVDHRMNFQEDYVVQ